MERTVPVRSSEEIDLYLRTIYSLLRSTTEVRIRSLEEAHLGMNSSLHTLARENVPDVSALIYSLLRLPQCIIQIHKIILGQIKDNFIQHGFGDVEAWQEVCAKARRRRCFFDGKDQMACYIASRSDIDDVVPILTALQIEWNKLHLILNTLPESLILQALPSDPKAFAALAKDLQMGEDDLARLYTILGDDFTLTLQTIASRTSDFRLQLLNGSLNDYRKATSIWWQNVERQFPEITARPVYFISSNTHSVANLLSGFALGKKKELLDFVREEDSVLQAEWEEIESTDGRSIKENFFYYALKKYEATPQGNPLNKEQIAFEQQRGIERFPSIHAFDVEMEIIDLARLDPNTIDLRLQPSQSKNFNWEFLRQSHALIINIDYPLGYAAYNLMSKIAENTAGILGIYIMGKAASLNGVRGDVILPNVVYDEHSKNTYLFDNHFSAGDVAPYLTYGTVLDNQKAVSVMGTFLQNSTIMDVIYREGYTDVEMEAGPYLSAIYELFRPQRYPVNEIVNLHQLPFDLGILHYVSDMPKTKGRNLGAGALSYAGVDPTYAVTLTILRRIMKQELARIQS